MGRQDQRFSRDKSSLSSILRRNKWLVVSVSLRLRMSLVFLPKCFLFQKTAINIYYLSVQYLSYRYKHGHQEKKKKRSSAFISCTYYNTMSLTSLKFSGKQYRNLSHLSRLGLLSVQLAGCQVNIKPSHVSGWDETFFEINSD